MGDSFQKAKKDITHGSLHFSRDAQTQNTSTDKSDFPQIPTVAEQPDAQKPRKKVRVVYGVLLFFFLALLVVSSVILLDHVLPVDKKDLSGYKKAISQDDSVQLQENPIDFKGLKERNPDICAWINIPGTNIDYPILQSGDDEKENFYLTHDVDRKEKFDGSIYIQKMNQKTFEDPNTVIYGHNLYNGLMFTQLHKFKKTAFFTENQYIYVYLPHHMLTYQIYSVFNYDDRHILNSFNFHDPDEYQKFLNETLAPASMVKQVREGAQVTTDDHILTLSTCNDKPSQRYLVMGVLKNDQLTQ